MSQMSFPDFEYASKRKQTRRERFLAKMDQVVPWSGLLALIRAVLSESWRWPQIVSAGNHAAKLVLAERSCHGRSAV